MAQLREVSGEYEDEVGFKDRPLGLAKEPGLGAARKEK